MYPEYPYYGKLEECIDIPITFPPQHQSKQPGLEYVMDPPPIAENPHYKGSGKLKDKVAIITGGDSGIGRAASIAFAKEGADVVIVYLCEDEDAEWTKMRIESFGRRCLLLRKDLRDPYMAYSAVKETIETFGRLNILVNNCAVQFPRKSLIDISIEQLITTFQTNIFSYFYMAKASLPYLNRGDTIINTSSVTAYEGEKHLIDYSSTKGAIVSFTRSLALSLVEKGIRVNAVAPGPIWTPLIPSSFSSEHVKTFGYNTPMKRAGQPFELAPAYVYLASEDSAYVSGQVLHVNGGTIVSS
ncbi:NAD(P)-dependent dehydrogenase (short-subunit alcohol dehydrogenase family) [Scopulibacillus daqui]|uniref:NAD(P)-dependent dehydrogenase (Short-subunit alcohol dehydrogenase family) n=1 Tax=Scopulibacillus daqui TaxID=1469162 RepID=A0ABS2PXT3_9BACL|nr:SDR family oxidoreductase [Scopulibacillus daqui]MBM7644122.1 NAD(P)-dependent dehydrogenase (short-subunit alcohol dehydrogenase family) [Scopulibacillus daqui]